MLADGTGQTTDTWTYDAWGETMSRTGVTENDYLYATVTGLKLEKLDKPLSVYNLDVGEFQSYSVADGVLVHNVCVAKEGELCALPQGAGGETSYRSANLSIAKMYIDHE